MVETTRSKPPEYTCPGCQAHFFQLTITQLVEVEFQGDGEHTSHSSYQPHGDMEWGDDTDAVCENGCGWSGKLKEALTEKPPVRYACRRCGSLDVTRDATVRWDEKQQAWALSHIFDNADCGKCNDEAKLVEVPVP